MKQTHDSDSKSQREVEVELVARLGKFLGVSLRPMSISLDGCHIQLDGHYEDEKRCVAAEAFSRIGTLRSGQRRKIMTDIFKLVFLDYMSDKEVEKYLVFADEKSATFLQGKSWAAKALNAFDIKIYIASLPDASVKRLLDARDRQIRGMTQSPSGN
ncbi:hypothetical protein AB1L42_20455 [Thalassoglobus sp. JC818]|uniref:hypothetical protein n=1 Tax=Thalassoglobus sp. JC818 TaxID=3232136 RepID=UPI003459CCBB